MKVKIRADSITVEGYVNAIERNSKPLHSRLGKFIERICKGAFFNALKRSDDVHVLLNHDWNRDLGSVKQGNLELHEDNIGLYARAVITDPQVIESGRQGNLVGWSFGFLDVPDGVEEGLENGLPLRKVRDLDLHEVSILDRRRVPAYEGNLIMARSEDAEQVLLYGDEMLEEAQIEEEEVRSEQPQQTEESVAIDYAAFDEMIAEMKGEVAE